MIAAVSAASSSGLVGVLRCVERCCPRTRQARRSGTPSSATTCSTQARRRAGPRRSPGGLRPDHLVERQVRYRPPKPRVLGLELLQALDLVPPQAAVLRAPAVVGDL